MKKLILVAIIAFGASLASMAQDDAQVIIKQKSDSLSQLFGQGFGGSIAKLYDNDPKMSKDEFMKGFNSVMQVDTTNRSYIEGVQVAMDVMKTLSDMERKQGIKLSRDLFVAAFVSQLMSSTPLTDEQLMQLNQQLQDGIKTTSDLVQANDPVVKAGAAYAEQALAGDTAFHRSASGLVYKVINAGSGNTFTASDRVRLNYKGTHVDGTVFDQSNDTTVLGVSQVVPGFSEALKMMRPGSKLIAIIPGDLAYGKRGAGGGLIKPNETLVFEIETYGVEAPVVKAAPANQQNQGANGQASSDRRLNPSVKTTVPPHGKKVGK